METLQVKKTDLTVKLELVTPELAKNYLRYNDNNRKISDRHVTFLSKQIQNDLFLENGEAIIFDNNGILKDGQHRLKAISINTKSYHIPIVRGVRPISMATYDTGKNRSASDVLELNGFKHSKSISAFVKTVDKYIWKKTKIGRIESTSRADTLTDQQILDYVSENYDWILPIIKICESLYDKQSPKILSRTQLSLYAFYLGGKEPESKVYDFLRYLSGINKESGTSTSYLFTKIYNSKKNKEPLNAYWLLGMVIKAYNYYIDGNPAINYFKFNVDSDLPKVNA